MARSASDVDSTRRTSLKQMMYTRSGSFVLPTLNLQPENIYCLKRINSMLLSTVKNAHLFPGLPMQPQKSVTLRMMTMTMTMGKDYVFLLF
ncbi:hypothetical protein Goshw_004928 [Gossypium schwendimanii]|uniref:Uncharacterized protein n=1 Tax=Gossypium schwendimanii TaxID=34291 RepID=A0A7J9NCX6_GOSSC|nr:hypothetical protein [Gossypium schwendimanii]